MHSWIPWLYDSVIFHQLRTFALHMHARVSTNMHSPIYMNDSLIKVYHGFWNIDEIFKLSNKKIIWPTVAWSIEGQSWFSLYSTGFSHYWVIAQKQCWICSICARQPIRYIHLHKIVYTTLTIYCHMVWWMLFHYVTKFLKCLLSYNGNCGMNMHG